MKKLNYVFCTCLLIGFIYTLSSCREEDDDNIKEDGKTVVIESKSTNMIIFNEDTFYLSVKVTKKDNDTYIYRTADKDAIFLKLFDQSAKLSEYGNFSLDKDKKSFEYGKTQLKSAILTCEDENNWYYVGKNAKFVSSIKFNDTSKTPTIKLSNEYPLDENHVILAPQIEQPSDTTSNN